jgi:hypothetical protein
VNEARPARERAADGKRALFSASEAKPGTVTVDCESCGARSRVGYVELAQRHLPVWLWAPWRRHSRYLSCPACGRRSWMQVHWRG